MIIGTWHRSVWLTYAGTAASVVGMGLVFGGYFAAAVGCLVIAGLADLFDGPVARSTTRTSHQQKFGIQLDSLADVISFVAFPVVLVGALIDTWWITFVLVGYAVAGLARLTQFTVVAEETASAESLQKKSARDATRTFYRGVPVTYAALTLPLVILTRPYTGAVFPWLLAATVAVVGFLFVWDVPVPKPRGIAYLFFGVLAVLVLVALVFSGV